MTLTQKISKNPYLKSRNLCDVADCEAAIKDVEYLLCQYPDSKMLVRIHQRILVKKTKLDK